MIAIDATQLIQVRDGLRKEADMVPFFRSLDGDGFKPEQEAYALRRGFDGGRALSKSTIRARQNRWSYYRKRTRGGVTATKPFSVWTGDYLRSTYGDHSKASYQVSKGQLVIKTDLVRSVRNPWDVVVLDKKLERRLEARIQMVLNRKRPPLRDKLGSRL